MKSRKGEPHGRKAETMRGIEVFGEIPYPDIKKYIYIYKRMYVSVNVFKSDDEDIQDFTEVLRGVDLSEEQEESLDKIFSRMEDKKRNSAKLCLITFIAGVVSIAVGVNTHEFLILLGAAFMFAGLLTMLYHGIRYEVIHRLHDWMLICLVVRGLKDEEKGKGKE